MVPDAPVPLERLLVILFTVACLTVVSEVLGTVGLFRVVPLTIALACAGLGLAKIAPAGSAPGQHSIRTEAPPGIGAGSITAQTTKWVAVVAVFVVLGEWLTATVLALHNGVTALDSIWYHLPTAARFAQSGSTWRLHVIDTTSLAVFYPAGSEVIHAVGMEFLGTDALSRGLNVGWLIVGLLAAWCIGSRWGVGPLTLLAAAVVFATPQLVRVDAGQALNDMQVVALVLSAIAIIVTCAPAQGSWLPRGSVAAAGVAAGLAAGTKWPALAPVAALTIGIPFLVRRGDRVRSLVLWFAALLVCGGYWYARNLVHVGSPIPPLRIGIGRIHFTQIHPGLPTFSIVHSLASSGVWRRQFLPGLRLVFGPAWWSVVALSAAGIVAVVAARERRIWIMAFVGAATVIAYLLTEQAFDITQWSATARFAATGIALGLITFAIAVSRLSAKTQLLTLAFFGTTILATQFDAQLWKAWWRVGGLKVFFVALVGTAFMAIAGAVVSASRTTRFGPVRLAPVIVALVVVSVAAGAALDWYQPRFSGSRLPMLAAARKLQKRHVVHSRIALTGTLYAAGSQYYFYDKRLTNYVQFIGAPGAHHTVRLFQNCEAFIGSIAAGRYDYVVAEAAAGPSNPIRWLRSDPAAREIFVDPSGRIGLFEIVGPQRRTGCAG